MSAVGFPSHGRVAVDPVAKPEPRTFLHGAIFLDGGRILGDETFRVVSLQGKESVSEPFEIELELHGNTDPRHAAPLSFDEIVGRPATFGIALDAKGVLPEVFRKALKTRETKDFEPFADQLSVMNGVVAAFAMDLPGVYRLSLKPALWKLTLTNRYTVHRSMNIRDAIAEVLSRHGIDHSLHGIEGKHSLAMTRTQDWLQAGETDYDFVRRLMAKAHIYYYHLHAGASHKLVFCNLVAYPRVYPDDHALRYTFTGEDELGLQQNDVVSEYGYRQSLVSGGVRSVFANQGAAWKQDEVAGFRAFAAAVDGEQALPFNLYKVYQYGVSTKEVEHFTAQTARTLGASGVQLTGASFCPRFRVAHQFKLRGTVRPEIDRRAFVLTQVQHEASLDGSYRNQFQATDARGLIAPFSVQETQQGAVLARVMPSPSGGSAPDSWKWYRKDNFGNAQTKLEDTQSDPAAFDASGVYVQFATEEGEQEPRTTFVKLAPNLTGVPEIGSMVLVSRANDESELPEIQSVQAAGSYTVTPGQWTSSTHVGNSYQTLYGDSKSVRYGNASAPDLDAATGIVEAQYRTGQFKEVSYSQGASYSYSSSESGRNGILSKSDSYGSTYSTHSAAATSSVSDVGTVYNSSTAGKSDSYNTVNGRNYSKSVTNGSLVSDTEVTGPTTSTTTHTGAVTSTTTYNGAVTSTTTHNGDVTSTTNHASGDVVNNSTYADKVTSTTTHGGAVSSTTTHNARVDSNTTHNGDVSSTTTHNGGVSSTTTHNGSVSSTTNVTGNSSSTNSVGGTATNVTAHNTVVNFSTTAAQSSTSLTGASNTNEVFGASNTNRVIGVSRDISVTVDTSHISMTGGSVSIEIVGGGSKIANKAAMIDTEIIGTDITLLGAIKLYV